MKISQPIKIIIGLTTAWFTLYPFVFFAFWLAMASSMFFLPSGARNEFPLFGSPFFAIFPLHCLTILLGFILDAVYLIHMIKNTAGSDTIRIILAIGIVMIPFIAMPLYYYLYIWLDEPPAWAKQPQQDRIAGKV
jgi:hypothetical protein